MIEINEKYEVDRRILKCDYIRYSPAETSTIITPNSQIYFKIPRENSVISLLNSYLEVNFEVIKRADNSRYANGNHIELIILGPIRLFSTFKLTTSSGKHSVYITHSHLVSLLYKLITSGKDNDDLSIGFHCSRNRRRDELAQNKNVKDQYHFRIILKDAFGFAEHQKKATYGLGYEQTLTRIKDDSVVDKAAGIADARINIDYINWYVPHYTPSIQQQNISSKQVLSKRPIELRYVERSVFKKEVNIRNLLNVELESQESMNIPIWIVLGVQQGDRQDNRNLNNDFFCRLPVVSAQCFIGTEEYLDAGILLNYVDNDYSQGLAQIKETFRALTIDNVLQPYISDDDFRSSNVRVDDVGYKLYVFDIRYQQKFTASQPIKVKFSFDGVVATDINGYALVLTNKIISISSDGKRNFELI